MFLFYRPWQAGCSIDPADPSLATATVAASADNTTDKYPEYRRVWDDGELNVVAMFGRELPDGSTAPASSPPSARACYPGVRRDEGSVLGPTVALSGCPPA
jgi:hypothetical protein